VFRFISRFAPNSITVAPDIEAYFNIVLGMFLAFGIAFELPVVVFFLSAAGIVEAKALWRGTPYAILVIFIVAAILTPTPDWVSQVLLGVPMVILYLLGVAVAHFFGSARKDEAKSQLPAPR
jgi:sec-independent protein translocase protein TatC